MTESKPTEGNDHKEDGDVDDLEEPDLKVILLGDSAVGKSKLMERYLKDEYNPRQLSTFALTLFRKNARSSDGTEVKVDFWDTAGQERFNSMHPSYYYRAHACILIFDVTRKATYKSLTEWYGELRQYCEGIPCLLVANKIDVDYNVSAVVRRSLVTTKNFKFADQNDMTFFFVSAADGTNVVKVFEEAIEAGLKYKRNGGDFVDEALSLLEDT